MLSLNTLPCRTATTCIMHSSEPRKIPHDTNDLIEIQTKHRQSRRTFIFETTFRCLSDRKVSVAVLFNIKRTAAGNYTNARAKSRKSEESEDSCSLWQGPYESMRLPLLLRVRCSIQARWTRYPSKTGVKRQPRDEAVVICERGVIDSRRRL